MTVIYLKRGRAISEMRDDDEKVRSIVSNTLEKIERGGVMPLSGVQQDV